MSALWRDLRDQVLAEKLAEANPRSWDDYLRIVQKNIPDAPAVPIAQFIGKRPPQRSNRKKPVPAKIRWEVWVRDDFTCRYCRSRRYLEVDHIYPESLGGPTTMENLQTLCRSCNSKKRDLVIFSSVS